MEELETLQGRLSEYLRPVVNPEFDWDGFSSFLEVVLKEVEEVRQERLLERRSLSYLLHDLKVRLVKEIGEYNPLIYLETNGGEWMRNNLALCSRLNIPAEIVQMLVREEQKRKQIQLPSPITPLSAVKTLRKHPKYKLLCDFAATRNRIFRLHSNMLATLE